MEQLAFPENLRLFGATRGERELSRGSHQIRIDFDLVNGTECFEGRLNGGRPFEILPGDRVPAPGANLRCEIDVRAVLGDSSSAWSQPLLSVTRPPVPDAPVRAPFDLSNFGIVLDWSYEYAFEGDQKTHLELYRTVGSRNELIGDKLGRDGRYIDTTYPANDGKEYSLVAVTVREAVPEDLLGSANRSLGSAATIAHGPHSAIPPGHVERSLLRARGQSQAMLILYGYPQLRS